MYIHFLRKSLHACPYYYFFFGIAKGLATCWLWGVISAQKSTILSPNQDRFWMLFAH